MAFDRLCSRFFDDDADTQLSSRNKKSKIQVFENWILQLEKRLKKYRKKCLFANVLNPINPKVKSTRVYAIRDMFHLEEPPNQARIILNKRFKYVLPTLYNKVKFSTNSWTRGRSYTVEGNTLYITPTNFPGVSYLDLAQFSIDVWNFCPEILKVTELETWSRLQVHPLVECPEYYKPHIDALFENFLVVYYSDTDQLMDIEFDVGSWVSMWHHWSPERFRRFLEYCLENVSDDADFLLTSSSLISLLRRHCAESSPEFVVDCFKTLAFSRCPRDFLSRLPDRYVETFLKYYRKVYDKGNDLSGGIWLLEENLVEHAFINGKLKRLQMLLQYQCPSLFVPLYIQQYFDTHDCYEPDWPREKPSFGGEGICSYMSNEYTFCNLVFIFRFMFLAGNTKKEHLTWCVRMLYRSIVSPFVPLQDIRSWIEAEDWSRSEKQQNLAGMALLPESFADLYAPRSLMHLCRCAIRQRCSTPDEIALLSLPSEMKSYLEMNK